MKFAQFLRNYEEKRIKEGELVLILCSNYLTVGNLIKIDYATPENPLEGYNSVYIKSPVNLELRPPAGKHMVGIRFTENNVGETSNRQEWNSYFFAYGYNKLSDIFTKEVDQISKFNSNLNPGVTNLFKKIIQSMETAEEITDEAILEILNERPEMYRE